MLINDNEHSLRATFKFEPQSLRFLTFAQQSNFTYTKRNASKNNLHYECKSVSTRRAMLGSAYSRQKLCIAERAMCPSGPNLAHVKMLAHEQTQLSGHLAQRTESFPPPLPVASSLTLTGQNHIVRLDQ